MNMNMNKDRSFFDEDYQVPEFILKQKQRAQQDRRHFLKSAAGMGAIAAIPVFNLSAKEQSSLSKMIATEPWLTLDATLNQLLPSSDTGPSAKEINATAYLYQVMTVQPTEQNEKDFILNGVGWLNSYANTEKSADFSRLSVTDQEQLLRGISRSIAGRNWLNTLLGYIFEAMLAPESYGGNPNGIGEQWLEHQAGFPQPDIGQRYFELPRRARIDLISRVQYTPLLTPEKRLNKQPITASKKSFQGSRKA
ncbi:MAG: gluconate 2-dehydrogenase subunit 3 family protein [Colwellia sp.]